MTHLIESVPLTSESRIARVMVDAPRVALAAKRVLDFLLAAVGLVVTLPFLLLIGVLVRIDSHGPSLFRQVRVGVGGRRFRIVKFRTMVDGAEVALDENPELRQLHAQSSFKLPVALDPRVTRVGRWLRRTSLDELPQLWNVLLGQMSLVGARPIEPLQVPELYGDDADMYCSMKPGLTGYWQVSGRSEVGDSDRAELDMHYLRNWSLGLDFRILLRTLPAVLSRRGAH